MLFDVLKFLQLVFCYNSLRRISFEGNASFFRGEGGEMSDVKIKAEADYMSGMKYKDIAEKYNVSLNTVKSWKKRYAWDRSGDAKKGAHKNTKRVHTKSDPKGCKTSGSSSSPPEEVVDLADNSDLTDKQKLFCVYYVRSFNATKAYMKAYDCDYETAAAAGSRLLKNVKVKAEINNLKQGRLNREMLSEEDIVQKYIDILYADAKDYIDPKRNKINLNNPFADGTLVKKVSFGKTDSVELLDKMKALQWLADHMSLATEKQKAEIELLKAKAEDSSRADEEQLQEKENNVEEILKQLHDVHPDEVME